MKNKYIAVALVVVTLIGVGGIIWWSGKGQSLLESAGTSATQDAAAIVATIHGGETTVTRAQLDAQIQDLAKNPQIQVPPASETETRGKFENLVLDQLIGGMLLFEEAQKQGFTADDAAVDAELATITAQYKTPEEFEKALTDANLTKDALRENIRHNLITNQYYDKIIAEHPVTVSEEQIRAFYDAEVAPKNATLVFDDIKNQIKTQLEQEKTQEVLKGVIDGLRQSADVKVLI
jgi:FKBP-type peptidyl-prolyl cis-trans isomerase (trigger factor)